jgi:hypothetical protein
MPWTTPKTWVVNEKVGASDLNTHLRDNLNALKAPSTLITAFASGALSAVTTATTFTAITGWLSATLTTYGGDVMLFMAGMFARDGADRRMSLDIQIDGTGRYHARADEGWGRHTLEVSTATSGTVKPLGPVLITGLASGQHTFVPLWKVNTGTAVLYLTTGIPAFVWVREVS